MPSGSSVPGVDAVFGAGVGAFGFCVVVAKEVATAGATVPPPIIPVPVEPTVLELWTGGDAMLPPYA